MINFDFPQYLKRSYVMIYLSECYSVSSVFF